MYYIKMKIGVLDSGLGGLTLVKELTRLLPEESIVYFGDNKNCPYGNRPQEEILKLSFAMLDFLQGKEIKIAAVACNTISALIDQLRERYKFPVVSIIEAACEYTAAKELAEIGVIATEFTIRTGLYQTMLKRLRPQALVQGVFSRNLAALVDSGDFDNPAITAEINSLLNTLKEGRPELKHVVLGCTHYPIVQDLFEKAAPDFSFINPAQAQAQAVKTLLSQQGLLAGAGEPGLDIYTSGEKSQYEMAFKKLGISRPAVIHNIP